jgi:hypothetical protein
MSNRIVDVQNNTVISVELTEEEKNQQLKDIELFNSRNTYDRKRALEYPAIGDQLDALFHAGVFPDDMAAQIQAVKDKYPKS